MEKTFKEVLEPKIRAKSVHLKTCTFTKIHFGEKVVGVFCNSCGSLFSEKFLCMASEMFSSVIALLPPHVALSIFTMKEGLYRKDTHLFPLAVSILGLEMEKRTISIISLFISVLALQQKFSLLSKACRMA